MKVSTAKTLIWLSGKDEYPGLSPSSPVAEAAALRELYQARCLRGLEVSPRGHEVIRLLKEENQGVIPVTTERADAFLLICAEADVLNHLLNTYHDLGLFVTSGDGRVSIRLDNKIHENYEY